MIDAAALLGDCKVLVRSLVNDLRQLTGTDPETAKVIDAEYAGASGAGRTALTKAEWAEGLYAQVAVAWVLGGVFVRFCEDNGLVPDPLLSGPGGRRAIALDHRTAYVQANPAHDDRHWLREIFHRYRALPATGDIFGDHNPVWLLAPSADGARKVVQSFQAVDPDTGEIRHDYTDSAWDTRFLGDLYQDLSDHAKKTYALLQTPIFVEEFILDRTLEPALATFGLRETTLIDPTCGSGHFLLGAFGRIFDRWRDEEPSSNLRELARRTLDAIAGVDVNPFAVAIARFRLLVAAMRAAGDTRLADAPTYPIHVAVGDSLLHGDPPGRLSGTVNDDLAAAAAHGYAIEDVPKARALLSRTWHAVVGNPPYITVKDPALRDLYRSRFKTCGGKYSLGVPFTERFFTLARTDPDAERVGYVGLITANSFMKREFGKKLIETWIPIHDLSHVIDTSGAYIPGHGTPTVILFGRNREPTTRTLRAVMGIRGEPSKPADPEKGLVWASITGLVDDPGRSSEYVSVVELERVRLSKHPWSIGGGGAAELKELLERQRITLGEMATAVGVVAVLGEDEPFKRSTEATWRRVGVPEEELSTLVEGDEIRDWVIQGGTPIVFPYEADGRPRNVPAAERALWPWRSTLANYLFFGKRRAERGLRWFDYGALMIDKLRNPKSIVFAEIATYNHFVLDRGGKIFKQTAPVIKLPVGIDDRRHLELLGVLNSSTTSFWLQQVCHNKGRPGAEAAAADERYEFRYVHDSTKIESLPLPNEFDARSASLLDELASELSSASPAAIAAAATPSAERLTEAERRFGDIRKRMIAAQERLDWEVYRLYGLVDKDVTSESENEHPLELGERAFEIVLARKVAAGEEETSWFARHGSTPITEVPDHWSEPYRRLVERRIELIDTDLNLGLIERPEHKRRWAAKPWDEQVKVALESWLLDRLESPRYWPEPAAVTTTARLAAEARRDSDVVSVAQLLSGRGDVDIAALLAKLVAKESVPYLAALRYTDTGLRKHAQWLQTWDLQRGEDAGEDAGPIPVPPKYTKADFVGVAWDHRGKLDVPKERFISYPGAERETDASLPIGWAVWDHLARARALATWYLQAKRDGRDREHLTPLLAGLAELVPWLKHWYDEANTDPALDRPGSQIAALLDAEMRALHLTPDDLASWRPGPTRRGRARR